MSAVSLTINALLAAPAVTAVVSNRIQPHPVKQGTALPAIAVTMSAENMEYLLGGASQYPQSSVQIHCLATAASAAIELGEAVKLALQDLSYTSSDTPPVHASFSKESVDFVDFSDDLTTYRRVMSFDIRWRAGSTDSIHEELPGVVADQAIEFGGKTLGGDGGAMALDEDGGEVEFVSVDSVISGTGTGWSVSGGRLVRSSPPASSNGAVLRCTTSNGQIDVTIVASGLDADGNDLAISWSVSTHTECYAAAQNAALAFGDNILCRTGSGLYNPTHIGNIQRPGNPVGTWTPPALYDADQPDQGYDLNTANFVKITKHAGADPIWGYMSFTGPHHAAYIRVTGLKFNRLPLAGFNPVSSWSSEAAIIIKNLADMVAVDNCEIYSEADASLAYERYICSGIAVSSGSCWVQDNYVHDVAYGISGTGSDIHIIGNRVEKFWAGAIGAAPANDVWINWNRFTNIRNFNVAYTVHPDNIQFSTSTVAGSGLRIVGNRGWVGTTGATGDHEGQGIFGGSDPANYQENAFIAGNTFIVDAANTLYLRRFKNAQVYSNTIVADPSAGGIPIFGFNVSDANDVQYNVYNQSQDLSPVNPSTFTNNVAVAYAGYAAAFVDPDSLDGITDPAVQYANKAGSTADMQSPIKAGAPQYVNYATRVTSFPWS